MNPRVVGLDVSTTCIGLALPAGELLGVRPTIKVEETSAPIVAARQNQQLTNRVGAHLRRLDHKPDLAVIERYLIATKGRAQRTICRLVELGGCIRMALAVLDIPFVEVYPAHLKQWATGSGAADKSQMIHAARSRGAMPIDDNEADAYWLRDLGISYFEPWDDLSELQKKILVEKVTFPALSSLKARR